MINGTCGCTPNIIMIVADDLGCCDLGCYGNTRAVTPNIDRLSCKGLMFTHHYSASPMCAPARAALLTGKYPHRTGAFDVCSIRGVNRINHSEITLPQLLKKKNYRTGLIGKWHNGGGSPEFHPSQYGYDEFCGFEGGESDYFDYNLERCFGDWEHVTDCYITDRLTDEAIGFVERNRQEPFYLQLAYNAPHRPIQVPEEEIGQFSQYSDMTKGLRMLYAMVTRMDRNIGRLMDVLEENRLMENTIVLLVSDNGPDYFGSGDMALRRTLFHGFSGHKGDVLEGGIRVPTILRWDKHLPAGSVCGGISSFIDWLPTFASLLGIDVPYDIDGENIWPLIMGEDVLTPDYFWHWTRYEIIEESNAAILHQGYKLYYPVYEDTTKYHAPDSLISPKGAVYDIVTDIPRRSRPNGENPPMLFYLPDDQKEQNDISGLKPELTLYLKGKLDAWLNEMQEGYEAAKKDTLR